VGPHATPRARGATLPGSRRTCSPTGLDADYAAIDAACDDVLAQVADADEVRVTSPAGTDITFGIGATEWLADTGMVHEPGDFSNLPAGEVFISPETATGTYVVDGTMMPPTACSTRTKLSRSRSRTGSSRPSATTRSAKSSKPPRSRSGGTAYNLAELGIGTNVGVDELVGSVLLDEKAGGTVHRDRRQRRDRWRDRRARPPRRNPPKPDCLRRRRGDRTPERVERAPGLEAGRLFIK